MRTLELSFKHGKNPAKTIKLSGVPENLEEAVKKYGDEIVFQRFLSAAVIAWQNTARVMSEAKKTEVEIQKELGQAPLAQKRTIMSPKERLLKDMKALSPEERAELVRSLKAASA